MNHLIPILKQIEIEYRTHNKIQSKEIWETLSNLDDWNYRIVQDFILRVKMFIESGNLNFVFKQYEKNNIEISKTKSVDLLIASLRRRKEDYVLTDIRNSLVIPKDITFDILEIWGYPVTHARNLCVEHACKLGSKYLLFIDDDIVCPNNSLLKLFDVMNKYNNPVVGANYYRKIEPLMSAHGKLDEVEDNIFETDLCAMGFTLINLETLSKSVPFPLFWEFGAEDGYWSMGEDAFFTKNVKFYLNENPLVDTSIEILHYDKKWKKMYGNKDSDAVYACNSIDNFEKFESVRVPNSYPLIDICVPRRTDTEPVACNFQKLKLFRGYNSALRSIHGKRVDEARTELIKSSIENNSEFILFVDNDIVPPEDGLCKLIKTMEEYDNIGAISGDYYLKGDPSHSVHLQLDKKGMVKELDRLDLEEDLVKSNWMVGLGFCLIRTSIFNHIREPWFLCHSRDSKENGVNEDSHFCELVFQAGYKIIIDKSVQCLHYEFESNKIYGNIDKNQIYASDITI